MTLIFTVLHSIPGVRILGSTSRNVLKNALKLKYIAYMCTIEAIECVCLHRYVTRVYFIFHFQQYLKSIK